MSGLFTISPFDPEVVDVSRNGHSENGSSWGQLMGKLVGQLMEDSELSGTR